MLSPATQEFAESFEVHSHTINKVVLANEQRLQKAEKTELSAIQADSGSTEGADYATDLRDQRVKNVNPGYRPELLVNELPITEESAETTRKGRFEVEEILRGEDDRLNVIIGPCSIHDPNAALEYAEWVAEMRQKYGADLEILMRFYPEKPRTTDGWKGLTNDPELTEFLDPENTKHDYSLGLVKTRKLMLHITEMGVPLVVERLNMKTPQYTDATSVIDVIGARNTLDQNARGFLSITSAIAMAKNAVDGSISSSIDTVDSVTTPHSVLGDHPESGLHAQMGSTGNETATVILRGGQKGEVKNYFTENIQEGKRLIRNRNEKREEANSGSAKLIEAFTIDASHDNSDKDHSKQREVIKDVYRQLSVLGEWAIKGVMIESNLKEGAQDAPESKDKKDLEYGQSITDGCIGLIESEEMLEILSVAVQERRRQLLNSSL